MKFKTKFDLFHIMILLITELIMLPFVIISLIDKSYGAAIISAIPGILIALLWISMASAYAVLEDDSLFIKYGFVFKKRIPYNKIRSIEKKKKWYSESLLGMKNSLVHVDIKYNTYDITCVSLKDNDLFIDELTKRIEEKKGKH